MAVFDLLDRGVLHSILVALTVPVPMGLWVEIS
jgi:hypothetical protein